jgi:hypothetical protein
MKSINNTIIKISLFFLFLISCQDNSKKSILLNKFEKKITFLKKMIPIQKV